MLRCAGEMCHVKLLISTDYLFYLNSLTNTSYRIYLRYTRTLNLNENTDVLLEPYDRKNVSN
jgi:hypothetical protein